MSFNPIPKYFIGFVYRLSNMLPKTTYQYGKSLFWLSISIVVFSVVGLFAMASGYSIPYLTSLVQEPTHDFFGSSLTLILSIISLVFIIAIFLVQNANQEYSSRLSSVILHDQYFLATIGFVLLGSIFSISGSYFELGAPYTLVGFAFSVSTILLVGAIISFAGYFINIANIIEYTTQQIENDITSDKIYKSNPLGVPLQDEEYLDHLTSRTQLIVSTCIKAIEKNQQPIVETCLNSLERITQRFLVETTERDVNDEFLQDLNDQMQFIGSVALEDYSRQKHSERVAETIGDIGVNITKSRELGTEGGLWAKLLEQMFMDSLEFDRTQAASISIRKLGEMSIAAINEGEDSVRVYQSYLENISTVCTARNHPYLAGLLQTLHAQYQKMYAAYLNALLTKGHVNEYDIQVLFEDFAESFNEAKTNYDNYNNQIVHAGIFGVQPFASYLAAPLVQHPDVDPRTQQYLKEYLEELVQFLRSISVTNVDANHPPLYKGYTQFHYVLEQTEPLEKDDNNEIILQLNDAWLDLVTETYETANENDANVDHQLNRRMSDVTALQIYFNRNDPESLSALIEPLAETYRDLFDGYQGANDSADRNLKDLYKQLKLAGAWINRFYDPKDVTPQLWAVLVEHFYEAPETRSKAPRRLMARYGYPTVNRSYRDTWFLQADTIWEYTGFQEEIAATLNGDEGNNYAEFHERLGNEQKT